MKLNPCVKCGNSGEFGVLGRGTVLICRECGARVEVVIGTATADIFEAWNKYNPLPKKEPVRYSVNNCRTCPALCVSDGKHSCSFNFRHISYVETPPTWCPPRESGSALIELKECA